MKPPAMMSESPAEMLLRHLERRAATRGERGGDDGGGGGDDGGVGNVRACARCRVSSSTRRGACVVELVDPCLFEATRGGCDGKPHVDPTYQRICGILGIRHTVVPTPGLVADAAKVRAALRDCGGGRAALSR